ncbi:MAG: hypothetical protein ACYC5Q_16205 [Thermoleophilia bacterium]
MQTADRLPHLGPYTFTTTSYDERGDVLYLGVGQPSEALTWESPEGHLVRLDPDTLEVVGLTVLGFAGRKARGPIAVTVPAPGELRALVESRHAEELEVPEGFLTAFR